MTRPKFTPQQQQHIDAMVERRLSRERRQHAADLARVRQSLTEVLAVNRVLSDSLDALDSENLELRRLLTELRTLRLRSGAKAESYRGGRGGGLHNTTERTS